MHTPSTFYQKARTQYYHGTSTMEDTLLFNQNLS